MAGLVLVVDVVGARFDLVGTVGIICGLGFMSSRTLLTAIALHALYNASIRIPEWFVYQTPLS